MIQLFESERLAHTEEVFGQYVRALAKADKLNGTALMQTLYRGAQSYLGAGAGAAATGPAARAADAGAGSSFAASALRPAAFALPGGLGGGAAPAAAALAGSEASLGSAKNPIYMMQAEPTFWSQLWRRWVQPRGGWAPGCWVWVQLRRRQALADVEKHLAASWQLAQQHAWKHHHRCIAVLAQGSIATTPQRAHAGPGLFVHGGAGRHG